jgi:putative nucleotidyltransferase with HDIG domain/diguanylate cyclase (GGDEF)-like protein
MHYRELPSRLRVLIVAQTLAAVGAAWVLWEPPMLRQGGLLACLAACGILASACKFETNLKPGGISLGFAVTYFALLLLGTPSAMMVALCSVLAGLAVEPKEGRGWLHPERLLSWQALFSASSAVLSTAAMGWVYHGLGGHDGRIDARTMLWSIVGSAITYYFIDAGGRALATGWSQGISAGEVFQRQLGWTWTGTLSSASVSACLLWGFLTVGLGPAPLLLLPPAYLVYCSNALCTEKIRNSAAHAEELNRLNDAIITSLAMAIEAKDRHTRRHTSRVREYAVRLAQKLEVAPEELEAIRIAALLHDVGKIGIPEQILGKPGKLSSQEYETLKAHVEIGAAILEQIRFPWPVVPIVRAHHERWDGLGYPQELRGAAIPIGGRILALVDVYDALTSDRPYRRAVSREQAVGFLLANSGSQFDPLVVRAFVELLPELDAVTPEEADGETLTALEAAIQRAAERPAGAPHEEPEEPPFADFADLTTSEPRLAALARRIADATSRAVPHSTFALYLRNEERGSVAPAFVSGPCSGLLEGAEIRLGEGVSGFVASTGEPVINAAASLDLARRLRPGDSMDLNSTLSVPLSLDGALVGALTLYHSSYNFYRPYHLNRLCRIGEHAAELLRETGCLDGSLASRKHAPAEPLPGKQSLKQFLDRQLVVSKTREEELAIILLGLADPSGSAAGADAGGEVDERLEELGELLREGLRSGDYVSRLSREELAVVLPRCGEKEAAHVIRRLLERLLPEGPSGADECRVAVGMSFYGPDGASPDSLLETAQRRIRDGRPAGSA